MILLGGGGGALFVLLTMSANNISNWKSMAEPVIADKVSVFVFMRSGTQLALQRHCNMQPAGKLPGHPPVKLFVLSVPTFVHLDTTGWVLNAGDPFF